jgi:hypothetical protein
MARMCLTERRLGCKGEKSIAQAIDSCTGTCAGLGEVEMDIHVFRCWRCCSDLVLREGLWALEGAMEVAT